MRAAEFCSPKHPDKICDRISDAILDACLKQDPYARAAIEVTGSHGIITVSGELTTTAWVDIPAIVCNVAGEECGVQVNISRQSPEISRGVNEGGAGDQGCVTGYACDENEALVPQEHFLAREICQKIYEVFPYDGKTLVVLDGDGNITTVVASFQNTKAGELKDIITEWLSFKEKKWANVIIHTNSAGDWQIGGFEADTGHTGRKIVADSYGPNVSVGGGCLSGKDATKIDRSAAYMARKIAVDLLKKYKARTAKVRLAYTIGFPGPIMTQALIKNANDEVKEIDIASAYDLSPVGMIKELNLREPQFEKTAEWGAFGNNFFWDKPYE